MARKPLTSQSIPPGIDRANIISIEKNFTELYSSLEWKIQRDILTFTLTTNAVGTIFTLPITWQALKDTYSEVYVCIRNLGKNYSITIPDYMLDDSNSEYNMTSSGSDRLVVKPGNLSSKTGSILSSLSANSNARLIILAR